MILGAMNNDLEGKEEKKKKNQQTQLLEALEQTSLASLPTEAMLQEKKSDIPLI